MRKTEFTESDSAALGRRWPAGLSAAGPAAGLRRRAQYTGRYMLHVY